MGGSFFCFALLPLPSHVASHAYHIRTHGLYVHPPSCFHFFPRPICLSVVKPPSRPISSTHSFDAHCLSILHLFSIIIIIPDLVSSAVPVPSQFLVTVLESDLSPPGIRSCVCIFYIMDMILPWRMHIIIAYMVFDVIFYPVIVQTSVWVVCLGLQSWKENWN